MVERDAPTAGPIDGSERSALLDSLRGWALLGILIANMVAFVGFAFLDDTGREATIGSAFDDIAELLLEWLVVGKFYSIFSLLFGIGFAIQLGRLEARGEGVRRYLRRLAVLFLIGLAHLLLLWIGDIVALYALMGALLLLFRRQPDRALIHWAVVLWLVPIAWSALIHFGGVNLAQPIFDAGLRTLTSMGVDVSVGPLEDYRDTGFLAALAFRPGEALIRLSDLVYQMRFTKVLGMFLIGLWVGRRAIYADLDRYAPLLRNVARWGLMIGLPVSMAKAVLSMWPGEVPIIEFAAEAAYVLGTPTLALGYAAGFALLWRKGAKSLSWAAPAGRMALTNYLMQTILQSLIFYGWGMGLIGTFGLIFIYPLSLAIFALQVAYSRWWLSRFRFGPVEWLWRSLTYGRSQPMQLPAA
jgi:uncharacterized protein